jgi:cytochrome c oxidase assembly factor 6
VEKVRTSTMTAAGTSEDWSYFLTRWTDYKNATKVTGQDLVFQLLERCEEPPPPRQRPDSIR